MPAVIPIHSRLCVGVLLSILSAAPLLAQPATPVRKDSTARADTARVPQQEQLRTVADDLLKSVIHPSPQSAAYARYGEYPVDYSTGVPRIEIPLYTLDTGDYQLPFSISYHAGGIRVMDVSSPVGLGWVLNAGGVISRSICAAPDFENTNYSLYFKTKSDVQTHLYASHGGAFWNSVFAGSVFYDSESDRYSYNFGGKAGVFRMNAASTSQYLSIPHEPIKIERTSDGFKITDTDGTQYFFENQESCSAGGAMVATSAWYLSRIVTGFRHNTITFSYTQGQGHNVRYREEYAEQGEVVSWTANSGAGFPAYSQQTSQLNALSPAYKTYYYVSPRLNSISWGNVTVSFAYATDRQDAQKERLTGMTVSDAGTVRRYVAFDNDQYFGSSVKNYRLKLDGITITGNSSSSAPSETWTFTYNSTTPPNHYNANIGTTPTGTDAYTNEDYWGFNNARNNAYYIPNGLVPGYTTANRSPYEPAMKMCSLESITYPTKGKTLFAFEANKVGGSTIGGLRVSSISNYDYDGTLLEKRSFSYADGQVTVPVSDDLYSWYDNVWYYLNDGAHGLYDAVREHFFAAASPVLPLTGRSGAPVFYGAVTEYIGGTSASNLGKDVYYYMLDEESTYPGSDEDWYDLPLHYRYYSNLYNNDEGTVPAILTKKEVYKSNGGSSYTLQLTENYTYTELSPATASFQTGVRLARKGIGVIYAQADPDAYAPYPDEDTFRDNVVATSCNGYRRIRLLTSKTVTDHTTGVAVATTYAYDSNYLRTLKPLSESVTNSDGMVAKTAYTYPFDMSGSPFAAMTGANIVDVPVREQYYYGGNLQRTRETTYGTFNSNMYLPSALKETLGTTTRTLISYSNYDSAGNLRYASTVDGRKFVFIWGYGYRYPVALVEGLTWSQVSSAAGTTLINNLASCTTSNASSRLASFRSAVVSPASLSAYPHLVSTFEYVPGFGIETETGPDGASRHYLYDALGRLSRVADDQGEIETYTYTFASGSGSNWIANKVLRSVKKNAAAANTARIESAALYDGLGRPAGELQLNATPSQTYNLLTRTDYDQAGRETRSWLPVVTGSTTRISDSAFAGAASSTYGSSETRPFAENVYEASSLNRIPYAYGPGAAWYGASGTGHPVKTEWLGNADSGVTVCKYYYVNGTSLAGGSTNYAAGSLSVVRTTDEDGAVSLTFSDKLGRTVMTRQVDGTSTYSDTYYIYDGRGQLRFVLQPQYQVSANLARFAFQYTYDDRGNLTKKQRPGADYVQYVYDAYDRPAYVQDGRRRAAGTNRWHYFTYDNLGRVVTEGECTGQSNTTSPTVLVTNYYDNYSFAGTTGFPSSYFPATGSWSIGRKTGQALRVLGASSSSSVPRAWYYDSRGQVTKEVIGHYDNLGFDTRVQTWTHTDRPASVVTTRTSSVSGTPASQTRAWSYDHVDRLTSETLTLPNASATTIASYSYDNLGRLSSRKFAGSTTNNETYTYDIRSRTTGITHPSFIQDLSYTYGSDISATGWKRSANGTRMAYDFSYDGLHRLKDAVYKEGSSVNNHYTEKVTGYDRNGNITTLQRYGRTGASSWGVVDNLTLTRTGNQLTSVSDSGSAAYSGDFNAAAGASTYNANGALATDSGRGISSVTWNEIDLPQTVTFSNGLTINYYYAADGTKLREVRTVSGTATTIDWCGDLVLEKVGDGTRSAKRLRLDGGYVDLATGVSARRYFVRDHLGSVRAVVNDSGTVLETDDYYPLGGPLPTGTSTALQPEKYQGKEWNPAAAFNVYDFGARIYDPALGRWLSQDPMAEKYYLHSPYLFCAGNPMKFVDPEGRNWYKKGNGVFEYYEGQLSEEEMHNKNYIQDMSFSFVDKENQLYYSLFGRILDYSDLEGKVYEKIDKLILTYATDRINEETFSHNKVSMFIPEMPLGENRSLGEGRPFVYKGITFTTMPVGSFKSKKPWYSTLFSNGETNYLGNVYWNIKDPKRPETDPSRSCIIAMPDKPSYNASFTTKNYYYWLRASNPSNGVNAGFQTLQLLFSPKEADAFMHSYYNLFGK